MMLYLSRHRWISRAFVPLCALAGAFALQACDRPQAQNKAESKAAAPLPVVTTSRPVVSDVIEWDEYTGRFEAVASVEIRARVSGYVDQIAFTDGQSVKKGDLLFVIDPRPFERVLATANAELEQARMKVQNTTMDVDRGRPLVERKIMSEKVFEDRASLQREAESAVKVTEAKVAAAELELSFTRITAPIDGRLSRANISLGSWISAGGTANATVLTQIVTQDPIQIYFDISENNYIKYKRLAERGALAGTDGTGAEVEVTLPDEAKRFEHRGRLDFVDNRLDPGTATMRARAVVPNAKQLFSPGMFARVRLAGTPKQSTVLLPDAAIGTDQANKFVLVVAEDGTVSRRNVELGPLYQGLRVVREGVGGEDWVVTSGLQRARIGQKVAPNREMLRLSQVRTPEAAGSTSR
jgi:multidrug efflux system membrane fusion protein